MTPPRALTIAGSDSGGGAGVQQDLKTFHALGVWGMSAITAVTAQNTLGVHAVAEIDPAVVAAQIAAVATDIGVDAAKTGMLASAVLVETVARAVADHRIAPLVVDPVMVSKHGAPLLRADAVDAVRSSLLPLAAIVTPNADEASVLAGGGDVRTVAEQIEAARAIGALGPRAVLVKGGHVEGDATDVLWDGERAVEIRGERIDQPNTHGTGCMLSAAIAAHLAHGRDLEPAVRAAKRFVTDGIRAGLRIGGGVGPVCPPLGALPGAGNEERRP